MNGRTEIVQTLIAAGATLNLIDKVSYGNIEVITCIYSRLAYIVHFVPEMACLQDGHSMLYWPCSKGYLEVVDVLIRAGVSVHGAGKVMQQF